jgi:hypothetical protein
MKLVYERSASGTTDVDVTPVVPTFKFFYSGNQASLLYTSNGVAAPFTETTLVERTLQFEEPGFSCNESEPEVIESSGTTFFGMQLSEDGGTFGARTPGTSFSGQFVHDYTMEDFGPGMYEEPTPVSQDKLTWQLHVVTE